MNLKNVFLIFVVLMSIILASTSFIIESQGVELKSIVYTITYNPLENQGILVVEVNLYSSDLSTIEIPVRIFGGLETLEIVDYNYTGSIEYISIHYDDITGILQLDVKGEGSVEIVFNAVELLDDVLGAYALTIDTTELKGVINNPKIVFKIPGEVDVIYNSTEKGFRKYESGGYTVFEFSGVDAWTIIFQLELQETTTPNPTSTKTPAPDYALPIIIVVIIAIVAAIFIVLKWREKTLIVEKIDYTTDEASKQILKALKDSENKGLTQSDISRITGLPKSVVSRRVRRLEEEGLLEVKRIGNRNYVYLTSKGLELAKKILEKSRGERK